MTDQRDEKFDEKDREKREEKSPQEKSWEEKWQRDPVNTVVWALIFMWAGLVILAENLGLLSAIQTTAEGIPGFWFLGDDITWSLIFTGAGVIVLLGVLARLLIPAYRRPVGGGIFFGFLLIAIGLGNVLGWNLIWPIFLIGLGLSIILRGLFR
ncbi:MAG: hypothetical protein ACWGO1_11995 [Anaerolineales bacterium]